MKKYEDNYLVIPMNIKITTKDAYYISKKINNFFNKCQKNKFKDLFVIQSERFLDNRGYFRELLRRSIKN